MSIRLKLSLSFILLFLLVIGLLLASFFFFYRGDYRDGLVEDREHYEMLAADLVKQAAPLEEAKIIALLAAQTGSGDQMLLFDSNNQLIWSSGEAPLSTRLSVKDYIINEEKIRYALRINYNFHSRNQVIEDYIFQYLWLIILLIITLFMSIAYFLHHSITYPLSVLHDRMIQDPLRIKIQAHHYRNDEIGELEKRYDDMLVRLQSSDREQQTMLAAISHDLRTPLTSIASYTDRLSSGKITDAEKINHYYSVIHQKSEDIRLLIDQFQEAAQIIHQDPSMNFQSVTAARFWQALLNPYLSDWDDVDASMEYNSHLSDTAQIQVNKPALQRVIGNILSNAVKYGGHPLFVDVHLFQTKHWLVLKIENNGQPVPDEQLPLLFDRFYRVEASRSKAKGGSGLGLYICRELITRHGGSIRAYQPTRYDFGIEIQLPLISS